MKKQILGILAIASLVGPMAAEPLSITEFNRPGAFATLLFDVNNQGIFVGLSKTGPTEFFNAFVFDGTSFTTLLPPGALGSAATGLNDAGTIVGSYFESTVIDEEGNVQPGPDRGFIYEGGSFQLLDVPGANSTHPRGISPDGRYISGFYSTDTDLPGFVHDRANGTFTIVAPDALQTIAKGINSSGILVGSNFIPGAPISRPGFLYDIATNTRTDVAIAGARSTALRDIDDAGNVVGFFSLADFVNHGFVGSVTSYEQIDFPGAFSTVVEGMNNAGILVGHASLDPTLGLTVAIVVTQDSDPATLLEELGSDVSGLGPGKSLASKVELAQVYYAANDIQAACAVLTGFVAEVRAQRGKKDVSAALADQWLADAQAIMDAIGCN